MADGLTIAGIATVIYFLISLAYSMYSLYLNRRQAGVKAEVEKTNRLLAELVELSKADKHRKSGGDGNGFN